MSPSMSLSVSKFVTIRSDLIRPSGVLALAATLALLAGCSSSEVKLAHAVQLVPAAEAVPEDQLLDIGVKVFDPGVPDGEIDKEVLEELLTDGTFVQIRRSESMLMAVELRDTLQKSGHWGAVWVTPTESTAADINIVSEILHSDGDIVRLHVTAKDATGRVWIDDNYELETAASAYNRQRYPDVDPYQDVYNSIANDLAAARASLAADEIETVRTVAALRYAGELSPESFAGYVEPNRSGIYEPVRLPADGDPIFVRTQSVRQRERLFFDTLDQHYESFSSEAADSYDGWREYSREEAVAIRDLTRQARWRTGIGIATIVASIMYGQDSDNNSFSGRVVRDAMMYVGTDMLRSGAVRRQERRLHSQTLEELSESFDDEVAPLVVEIAGTQHRLTGTAEVQYAEWRDLLQQMFIRETGFEPETVEIYAEPIDDTSAETDELTPIEIEQGVEAKEVADATGGPASGV
jgi:hypothetical protein